MDVNLLEAKFLVLYVYLAAALYVHLRGQERFPLHKQLFNHASLLAPYNAVMYLFSAVPPKPYVDVQRFPQLEPLRENWQMIREEALKLFEEGQIKAASNNNDIGFNSFFKRGWKRFYIKWYEDSLSSAKQLCPRTTALLDGIPTVTAAMFALLPPGSKLTPHRDPFGGSLRYQLGLVTPNAEGCHIVVDGQSYYWRDGEAVMFDETFIHYAENNTDQTRLILFCDIERPLRSKFVTWLNRLLMRNVVKASATQNQEGEKVGAINRFYANVYWPVASRINSVFRRLKQFNRPLYRVVKIGLIALLLYLIFIGL